MTYIENTLKVLKSIANGFFQWPDNNLSPKDEKTLLEVERNSLKYLFRLIFLFYYEDNPKINPNLQKWVIGDNHLAKIINILIHETRSDNTKNLIDYLKSDIKNLGRLYEQLLEYKLVFSSERLDYKKKKEIKKVSGTYYTPHYIVEYIVKSTVGAAVEEKWKVAELAGKDRVNAILTIKVLDPAMGSGIFLLFALEFLAEKYLEAYFQKKKKLYDTLGREKIKSLLEKTAMERVLANCIHGIDSDDIAVEIARFSLLSRAQQNNAIPHYINHKIKHGNSLALNWNEEFPEVFTHNVKLREGLGFDIVLGNPPYIDSEEMSVSQPELRAYCNKNFETAKGNWDLYVIFVELAINIAKQNGMVSQIVPNKILAAEYASSIRKRMLEYTITTIRDYSSVKVFNIDVYPIIYNLTKVKPNDNDQVKVEIIEDKEGKLEVTYENNINYEDLNNLPGHTFSPIFNPNFKLIGKILSNSERISDFFTIKGGASVSEAYEIKKILIDKAFNEPLDNEFILVNSGTIFNYSNRWGIEPTNYIKDQYRSPVVKRKDLNKVSENRVNQSEFSKVIISGMSRGLEAMYDANGKYLAGKSTVIIYNSKELPVNYLKFITGVLNSKLTSFVYKALFKSLSLQGGYMRVGPPQIEKLPIILNNKKIIDEVATKVDSISETLIKVNNEARSFLKWISMEWNCDIDTLSLKTHLWKYWIYNFEEILRIAKKNNIKILDNVEKKWKLSKTKIVNLLNNSQNIQNEINKLIFQLYKLEKDEITHILNSLDT